MKLIVISGQTSSGKSDLAVDLAIELKNACIVSCDSRQVYKKLDLGTGKVEGNWKDGVYKYRQIDHYLIDYINPNENYTLANFLQDWTKLFKNKMPEWIILTGGTGLYSKAVLEEYAIGSIKPSAQIKFDNIKKRLKSMNLELLKRETAKHIDIKNLNESDIKNPRRLQSIILRNISKKEGWTVKLDYPRFDEKYHFAIEVSQKNLRDKIQKRFEKRVSDGMVEEIRNLDISTEKFLSLGLEYRIIKLLLLGMVSEERWRNVLINEIWHYAKRQYTWLKKQTEIIWIKNIDQIVESVKS